MKPGDIGPRVLCIIQWVRPGFMGLLFGTEGNGQKYKQEVEDNDMRAKSLKILVYMGKPWKMPGHRT